MTAPSGPLDTFVVLAKSATGAACADLIKHATSANGVYSFTALLECENVQKVEEYLSGFSDVVSLPARNMRGA